MSRVCSLILAGFGVLLGSTSFAAAPAWTQAGRIIPPIPPASPAIVLSGEEQTFRFIAHELHLDESTEAVESLRAESSIDHLHDYRGEAILVVKPELRGARGESRTRAADRNYPFFVFRQTEHGWFWLGQMQGTGYEWSTQSRHLVFRMYSEQPGGVQMVVRYEVNSSALVNLTLLAREEREYQLPPPDWHHAY